MDEGPGFPFFLPKGMVLKNTLLIDYWREIHRKRTAMQEISTPDHPQPEALGAQRPLGSL